MADDYRRVGGLRSGNRLRKDLLPLYDNLEAIPRSETFDIVGKGSGSTKTTTTIIAPATIVEVAGVGDEAYLHWGLSPLIALNLEIKFEVHWLPMGSEVGKLVSWEVTFVVAGPGFNITLNPYVVNLVDAAIPETASIVSASEFFIDGESVIGAIAGAEDLHMKVKRVASSSDPVSDVALDHVDVHFFDNLLG